MKLFVGEFLVNKSCAGLDDPKVNFSKSIFNVHFMNFIAWNDWAWIFEQISVNGTQMNGKLC